MARDGPGVSAENPRLKISRSLRREGTPFRADVYPDAREHVSDERALPLATFPESPPPELERALNAALAGGRLHALAARDNSSSPRDIGALHGRP